MARLVLTVVGDDQSGLVRALASVVADRGGNWEESQMSHLAGKFAGIVLVTVADTQVGALMADLEPLEADGLLDITAVVATDEAATPEKVRYRVELVGSDRPGIVHDISAALASRNVSIEELRTATRDAPMAGGTLFEADATVVAPAGVSSDDLREALETVANELMVDLDFGAADDDVPGHHA